MYGFSHLTFQEYLAALAVAGRDDYVAYTLERSGEAWWREVILLEAGHLSMQSRERTTRLIQAIAERKEEPSPYHNLILAAACVQDVERERLERTVAEGVNVRLRHALDARPPAWRRWLGKWGIKAWIEQRGEAIDVLVRGGAGYWSMPYGEPEWVEIPAGSFLMGSDRRKDPKANADELPQHEVELPAYLISRVPVTNAQYRFFVAARGHEAPAGWENGRPPKGKESHPVVDVTWHDAVAYCAWLSEVTGRRVGLPSEAEWEKAARGTDGRIYPWGNRFEATRCNSSELGLGDTTQVGVFLDGASPYGVLDMAGNVWEWCRTKWEDSYRDYNLHSALL